MEHEEVNLNEEREVRKRRRSKQGYMLWALRKTYNILKKGGGP